MHCVGSDEEMSGDEFDEMAVGDVWEAVGPFPSGMREHPLTASPLHAFVEYGVDADRAFAASKYDEAATWPSELAQGGRAGWNRFKKGVDGWVEVSYPDIHWAQLRADRGWASLQYQVNLRTTVSIPSHRGRPLTSIRLDAPQAVEYAFVSKSTDRGAKSPVVWYQGDVYDFAHTPKGQQAKTGGMSNFARSITLEPGEYIVLVRALYEIRMFGDPGNRPPVIRFKLEIEMDRAERIEVVPGLNVVPDAVDQRLMGRYIGIALRVPAGDTGVVIDGIADDTGTMTVKLVEPTRISPGQTRVAVVKVDSGQRLPTSVSHLPLVISYSLASSSEKWSFVLSLPIRHFARLERPFRMAFASPAAADEGQPAQIGYAMVIPPLRSHLQSQSVDTGTIPVILSLHGAGVDVESEECVNAIPSIGGWAVLPTGKNEWGEDWHGASMADAWAAREALNDLVAGLQPSTVSNKTILLGHSNGGQGAWHLASHYPDRIVGVVAAAGFTKIQDYVPYSELTGSHHADPALLGILLSALGPYNNDLHLSNLANIPCLAFHGGADSNVPPRHSRSYASIIDSWQHDEHAVEVVEVPGKDHWYEGILKHPRIIAFLEKLATAGQRDRNEERKKGFTLSCAIPEECGGRAGIRIVELDIPGRIARLDVNARHWLKGRPPTGLDLRGMNVKRIEVVWNETARILEKQADGQYQDTRESLATRAYGPMIRILSSMGPLHLVVGSDRSLSLLAARIAHDVFVHHRLDCVIMDSHVALENVARGRLEGNIVAIGRPEENVFVDWLVRQRSIPVSFPTGGILRVKDKTVYEDGAGIISLLPHPVNAKGLAMIIAGNDPRGLETAARAFPIRTGVPIPDWLVVGPRMGWQAAGGVIGAGFWDGRWKYGDSMSWFDR